MPAVLPPQVPVAVVEYLKENDYLTDKFIDIYENKDFIYVKKIYDKGFKRFTQRIPSKVIEYVKKDEKLPEIYKNINSHNARFYITNSYVLDNKFKPYKGYRIYKLRIAGISHKPFAGCNIILHKFNETKCATEEEVNEIMRLYPILSPLGIPSEVIEFVQNSNDVPIEFKNINQHNADQYLIPYIYDYFTQKQSNYKEYFVYFLGFPYIEPFESGRCQIILQKNKEVRCATEDEHYEITVVGADTTKCPAAVYNYLRLIEWFPNNENTKFYIRKLKKQYNGNDVYSACYNTPKKYNIKENQCITVIHNIFETRKATENELKEIFHRNK